MSTSQSPALDSALAKIPTNFRKRIVGSYLEMKHRLARSMYDSSFDTAGLSAGKFCESTLRFLQQTLTGSFTPFGQHIPNFPDACRSLVQLPQAAGLESLRIIIPRALVFLYTLRGKRGIGHTGGDVEANAIDAQTIVRVADWIVCELIRVYHSLSLRRLKRLWMRFRRGAFQKSGTWQARSESSERIWTSSKRSCSFLTQRPTEVSSRKICLSGPSTVVCRCSSRLFSARCMMTS